MSYNYKPGLGLAASYQVSGIPYVTGGVDALAPTRAGNSGEVGLKLPLVSRWVVVSNNGNTALRVGFSQNGVTATNAGNYLTIAGGGVTDRLELKVTEIWLSGSNSVSVMAGLTGIETSNINNQTMSPDGTNWSGSVNAVVG
tara:strand:+ start:2085 stop:2510 length:426 start_codon:yes stop_codon:yes gene_type:complete